MIEPAPEPTPAPAPEPTPAPAPEPTPAPTPTPAPSGGSGFDQFIDAINSLPEKVANAVREASQAATPPAPTEPPTGATPPAEQEPGKRSFAEWWFGK